MLAHRRYDLELVHCYSWSTKRWYSPLRFQFRLSAAYYVSLNLAYAGHHGLVGLGLSEWVHTHLYFGQPDDGRHTDVRIVLEKLRIPLL